MVFWFAQKLPHLAGSLNHLAGSLKKDKRGQDLIEYALLGALIAVACVASMQAVATALNGLFASISGAL